MGKYTDTNRPCATKDCDHFVADHSWNDKNASGKVLTDETEREAAQADRGACHVAGCSCKSYKDDETRAAFTG